MDLPTLRTDRLRLDALRPAPRVRWGEPVDLVLYGVLREDWEAS